MKHLKTILTAVAGAVLITGSMASLTAADDVSKKDPKDIHDVMEWTHKGRESMAARVRDGKGSKDEVATLLRFYKFMATQKAPEGDAASWKEKTTALIAATEKLQKGDASAADLYKTAVNCKACHDVHKPKDE
ncbi:MAG TPA: hypothetical protein VLD18_04640 [Verrucomicrobiae bacterium]|nr:hypothetical protein [Verrucomicrobiae bacterium]